MNNRVDSQKGVAQAGSVTRNQEEEAQSRGREASDDSEIGLSAFIGRFLAIASFVGVVLSLLGYGVALATEARFGMPRAQLIDSTMDMLDLSSWVILQVVTKGFEALGTFAFYKKTLWETRYALGMLFTGWLIALVVLYLYRKRKIFTRRSTKQKSRKQEVSDVRYVINKTWWMPVSILIVPLVMLLGVVLILVAAAMLTIVPIVGMSAGKTHIDNFVVAPEKCVSLANRARRLELQSKPDKGSTEIGVQCVSVTFTEGDLQVKGRVVFALSKVLILYDPESGAVKRVPTENAIVEVIPAL